MFCFLEEPPKRDLDGLFLYPPPPLEAVRRNVLCALYVRDPLSSIVLHRLTTRFLPSEVRLTARAVPRP
jgi:hypothetical protein